MILAIKGLAHHGEEIMENISPDHERAAGLMRPAAKMSYCHGFLGRP
jgi:ferritin-like metal-binding protein YciE